MTVNNILYSLASKYSKYLSHNLLVYNTITVQQKETKCSSLNIFQHVEI